MLRERAVRVEVRHRLGVRKLVSEAPEHRPQPAYVPFRARERETILAGVARQWRPTVERFSHSFVEEVEKALVASQMRCELRRDPGETASKFVDLVRQLSDESSGEEKVRCDDDPFRTGARHELKGIREQGLSDSRKARNHPVKRSFLGGKSDDFAEISICVRIARSASDDDKGGLGRIGCVAQRGSRAFDEQCDEAWVNTQRACRLESDAGAIASSIRQRERHIILDVPGGEKEEGQENDPIRSPGEILKCLAQGWVRELDISVYNFEGRSCGAVGRHHRFKLLVGRGIAAPVPDDENTRSHWESQCVNNGPALDGFTR
jgi:hypothetical protein